MRNTAYLILENGRIFEGVPFGVRREVVAEVVFATGMTGYLETLTDKSYYGQIVTQTFPLVGNYGVIPSDFEGDRIGPCAYIVKNWCRTPSNFRSEGDLDTFFKDVGVAGLSGIDTRSLTKTIRESGVMNGMITYSLTDVNLEKIRSYRVEGAVPAVSVKEPYTEGPVDARYHVALMDYGMKENIKRELIRHGCRVTVCPYDIKPEAVAAMAPDGIMLSNGPGDPADNAEIIENLRRILQLKIPIFGICLGHQLLALANGFSTCKLKYGHRGANQPVKNTETGRIYISSQNHGYAVVSGSIDPAAAEEWFINVNDGTCEGIRYRNIPAFSVQFHPEACGGPQDTEMLFGTFIENMEAKKHAAE